MGLKTKLAAGMAVACASAALLLLLPSFAAAKNCGDRYGQLTRGPSALLILKRHKVGCPKVRRLGRALLRGAKPLPRRIDGFRCRRVHINAGGGAARCTRIRHRRHWVLFGFE